MNIKELLRPNIRDLAPYSTARDEYQGTLGVYLDANENPFDNGFNRYPDPRQKELKKLLSQIKGLPVENIFIGNGSDEPIDLVYRLFCEPGVHNAVSIAPTYGMYKVAAAINNVEFREVQLGTDFSLDPDALLAAADDRSRLLFICSPNNPSGNLFPASDIERILREFPGIVVLDEAYIDFAGAQSFITRLTEFPNLIVLQTLSKAWAMAGLRLGLAFASAEIVETLSRVKYPYNINVVTQQLVAQQLEKPVTAQVAQIVAQRDMVIRDLKKLPIVRHVYPSDANFVLARFDNPRAVYEALVAGGVIVRDRSRIKGCEGCLRITIGTPEENMEMLEILSGLA